MFYLIKTFKRAQCHSVRCVGNVDLKNRGIPGLQFTDNLKFFSNRVLLQFSLIKRLCLHYFNTHLPNLASSFERFGFKCEFLEYVSENHVIIFSRHFSMNTYICLFNIHIFYCIRGSESFDILCVGKD